MSLKERIAALLKVKSLVTLALTVIFCGLAWREVISGEQFMNIFTVIIAFYFGTQTGRKED
jgi:hypothetical protein